MNSTICDLSEVGHLSSLAYCLKRYDLAEVKDSSNTIDLINPIKMNRFKQLMRRLLFIALILLAGIGVGLSGGIPIPNIGKRKDKSAINKESVEKEAKTEKASAELRG